MPSRTCVTGTFARRSPQLMGSHPHPPHTIRSAAPVPTIERATRARATPSKSHSSSSSAPPYIDHRRGPARSGRSTCHCLATARIAQRAASHRRHSSHSAAQMAVRVPHVGAAALNVASSTHASSTRASLVWRTIHHQVATHDRLEIASKILRKASTSRGLGE